MGETEKNLLFSGGWWRLRLFLKNSVICLGLKGLNSMVFVFAFWLGSTGFSWLVLCGVGIILV